MTQRLPHILLDKTEPQLGGKSHGTSSLYFDIQVNMTIQLSLNLHDFKATVVHSIFQARAEGGIDTDQIKGRAFLVLSFAMLVIHIVLSK